MSIGSPSKLEGVPDRAGACVIPIHRSPITGHDNKSGFKKKSKSLSICFEMIIKIHSQFTGHRSQVTGHWSRVTGHGSLVTGHGSRVTVINLTQKRNVKIKFL